MYRNHTIIVNFGKRLRQEIKKCIFVPKKGWRAKIYGFIELKYER